MTLLTVNEVIQMTRLSRSTIYRLEKIAKFPSRKNLSARRVAWDKKDIDSWLGNLQNVVSPESIFELSKGFNQ